MSRKKDSELASHNISNLRKLAEHHGCCDQALGHLAASDLRWFNGEVQRLERTKKLGTDEAKRTAIASLKDKLYQRAKIAADS
jgi:hypothetical protein